MRVWSYHVILLFCCFVSLQPPCCRLWFLSAVKLNLTSSVLDERSPRETHSEDCNKPLSRKSSVSGLTQLGDTSDKILFNTSHEIWCGGWAVCDLQSCDLQRLVPAWPRRAARTLSALLLPFLPTPCAFHPSQDQYGRDRSVSYRDSFHSTLVSAFLPLPLKEFSTCLSCPEFRCFPGKPSPPAEPQVMKVVLQMGFFPLGKSTFPLVISFTLIDWCWLPFEKLLCAFEALRPEAQVEMK